MLKELLIKNIVLIEKLKIDFKKGLSVLTGETGTGKSILLDCLGLIIGNRVDFSLIRNNETEASVTAIFYIHEKHPVIRVLQSFNIDFENEIIIRRQIKVDGRSKCIVNDTTITRNALVEITDYLIEIQGQFEDRGLLDTKTHLSLLDSYSKHENLIKETKASFNHMKKLGFLINETMIKEKKLNDDSEWIKDSLEQLILLNPQKGEEEKLHQDKQLLNNREKVFKAISKAKSIIEDEQGLEDLINNILKTFDDLKSFQQPNLKEALETIYRAKAEIEDLKILVSSKNLEMNESSQNLETIDDRLHELRSQSRKHNCKVDDLIEIKQSLENKIDEVNKNSSNLDNLKKKYDEAKINYISVSNSLSESRQRFAINLTEKINKELPLLKLENANFKIKFEKINFENCSIHGTDKVLFHASTNIGMDDRPLNKIASGGELSRFLLAIKVVLETEKNSRTIIFDEIDSGIGGAASNAVGERLSKLGKIYQTMVVTHSPQVTSKGHYHYLVQKQQTENKTTSNVSELNGSQRVEEIARMVAGQTITKEAREAAQKLLDN